MLTTTFWASESHSSELSNRSHRNRLFLPHHIPFESWYGIHQHCRWNQHPGGTGQRKCEMLAIVCSFWKALLTVVDVNICGAALGVRTFAVSISCFTLRIWCLGFWQSLCLLCAFFLIHSSLDYINKLFFFFQQEILWSRSQCANTDTFLFHQEIHEDWGGGGEGVPSKYLEFLVTVKKKKKVGVPFLFN